MKKSKKILSGIMALCLIGGVGVIPESIAPVVSMAESAEEETEYTEGKYEKLTYKNYGDYIEISGCDESATEVVIPSEIDGVPVTSIGYMEYSVLSSLKSIEIPDSITSIDTEAFGYFKNLESINVSENNKYYSDINGVLFNKDKTELIRYPIERYGTKYIIPDSVTNIGNHAFFNCKSLKLIKMPDSLTNIGLYAFASCSNLTSIKIPNNVTDIESGAFLSCTNLSSIEIPNSVTSIGVFAFSDCESLTSIVIPDSVTNIENGAFSNCSVLTSINIPNSITNIKVSTFSGCSSLTSINIPDSVTHIGGGAFSKCSSLKTITILNPDCYIRDNDNTISNGYDYNGEYYFTGTIYGYENSTAQAYAEKYGYKFESLGKAPEKEITATGDINGDGDFSISDVVTIQKYILGDSDVKISDWKQADLNSDGVLDVFDLCLMKKKLIEK